MYSRFNRCFKQSDKWNKKSTEEDLWFVVQILEYASEGDLFDFIVQMNESHKKFTEIGALNIFRDIVEGLN